MSFDKETKRNSFFEQMKVEIDELIDPTSSEPYQHMVEQTDCPVCSERDDFLLKKWGFSYERCPFCSLIFVNPRLTESATRELYKKGSEANKMWSEEVHSSQLQKQQNNKYFSEQLNLLLNYYTGKDQSILDVGCGNGDFLSEAREKGFNCEGLELEENAVKIARSKGIEINECFFGDQNIKNKKYDVISMFGLLEPLFYPVRDIRYVYDYLKNNGLFIAITPNSQSLVGIMSHEHARFFTPRNHPIVFNFKSINYLFEINGFEIIHIDTVLSGYESIVNYVQYNPLFGDLSTDELPPILINLLTDRNKMEKLLWDYDLGLRLRVIAKKKS